MQQNFQLPSTESSIISSNAIDDRNKISHIGRAWPTAHNDYVKNDHRSTDLITDYLLKRRQEFSVTGTPKPTTTNLNDLFITVKTTKSYHDTRLALIIKTWFQLAKDQVSSNILLFSSISISLLNTFSFIISPFVLLHSKLD